LDNILDTEFSGQSGVVYVSIVGVVCPSGSCPTETEAGVPMEWDPSHLTKEGSLFVSKLIWPKVEAALDRITR
jgi:hypothetical protein